ncbi:methyltransferase domain-containing protein [Oceanirhabdus sp. W0125-5]|uniref:methyltransferase domain-containing protein n=1 Tax=Oceanirhabdus sp. W0125-5 TaxID=2999116 RepID=UPI0022F2DE1F|nr:methyltransferase domain-containing protein [Oceanirhabdus sp. W0125-5]WBW98094.1 methyltransferase domain-containing protein [Oceanirhabdus sp. W0125-5]
MDNNEMNLYSEFNDGDKLFKTLLNIYDDFYNIKTFEYNDISIDYYQYLYCRNMSNFVLLVVYSFENEYPSIFFTWGFEELNLVWDIPSSGVPQEPSYLRDIIFHTLKKYIPRVHLKTVNPISIVKMNYTHKEKTVTHDGIVFICSASNLSEFRIDNSDCRGMFIPLNEVDYSKLTKSFNRDVINYSIEYIMSLERFSQNGHKEINIQKKYHKRYVIHEKIFKRIITLIGYLYKYNSSITKKAYKQKILDKIPKDTQYLLDIAVGDDKFSFDYCSKAEFVILNDVSWESTTSLRKHKKLPKNILFTNEDIINANFKSQSFDIVICKNCIHHFSSINELEILFKKIVAWSRGRIIISEVLHPFEVKGFWPKIKDFYYRNYLRDVGDNLLTKKTFNSLIERYFINDRFIVNIEYHLTVMGINCLVTIDKKNDSKGGE